jgi:thymidylate synthase (FAD)
MKVIAQPSVFLIGSSHVEEDGLQAFLDHINASNWKSNASTDVEKLIEVYGRGCYESWGPGTHNLNIRSVRSDNSAYLRNILRHAHGSVLEHATLNFMICDCSRVFTHELVRHRVGTAFSEESGRYVRKPEMGFWVPTDLEIISSEHGTISIQQVDELQKILIETVCYVEDQISRAYDVLEMDKITDFEIKKRLTTIVRRIAPEGQASQIGFTSNIRTMRHLLEARTSPHAEEEIRIVFGDIGHMLQKRYNSLFGDYVKQIDGHSHFVTQNLKV